VKKIKTNQTGEGHRKRNVIPQAATDVWTSEEGAEIQDMDVSGEAEYGLGDPSWALPLDGEEGREGMELVAFLRSKVVDSEAKMEEAARYGMQLVNVRETMEHDYEDLKKHNQEREQFIIELREELVAMQAGRDKIVRMNEKARQRLETMLDEAEEEIKQMHIKLRDQEQAKKESDRKILHLKKHVSTLTHDLEDQRQQANLELEERASMGLQSQQDLEAKLVRAKQRLWRPARSSPLSWNIRGSVKSEFLA